MGGEGAGVGGAEGSDKRGGAPAARIPLGALRQAHRPQTMLPGCARSAVGASISQAFTPATEQVGASRIQNLPSPLLKARAVGKSPNLSGPVGSSTKAPALYRIVRTKCILLKRPGWGDSREHEVLSTVSLSVFTERAPCLLPLCPRGPSATHRPDGQVLIGWPLE